MLSIPRKAEHFIEMLAKRKKGKIAYYDEIQLTAVVYINKKYVFYIYEQIYIDGNATCLHKWVENAKFKRFSDAMDYWFNYCYTA